jgi:flagellar protein FlaH
MSEQPHDSAATVNGAKKKVILSRNVELDSKLGEGIPAGSLLLIEGGSGSGKSVLSQQLIWGALNEGFRVSLFTSENTVSSLITQMQSIDLDVLDFLLLGKFRAYPTKLASLGAQASSVLISAMRQEKQRNTDVIVIDSLTAVLRGSGGETRTLNFFEECKQLCRRGQTVMVTLHDHALDEKLINAIRSMCDAHLQLRSGQDGQRLVKTLEVAKIRGAASSTGAIIGFDVEPGWGMRVIPISKARG